MIHDLLRNILAELGAKEVKVEVCDLRDDMFYAMIHIHSNDNRTLAIDARPSDAVALALRTDSPTFVAEDVIKKSEYARLGRHKAEIEGEGGQKATKILEGLSSEDFGKYKM